MSILIVGSEGSMGKRYQAILRYLEQPFLCEDIEDSVSIEEIEENVSGIIIATPTETHTELIREFLPFKKPILCEKPITKNLNELRELRKEIQDAGIRFQMMFQYKHLINPHLPPGESYYDYFRHGNDGLVWDCLQIVGLAKGELKLKEESPVWRCRINGHHLSSEFMDAAYVYSVNDWIHGLECDFGELLEVHQKTWELANG